MKILENQVLLQLRSKIVPDPNQHGGIPRCEVELIQVELWAKVLAGLEGGNICSGVVGVQLQEGIQQNAAR